MDGVRQLGAHNLEERFTSRAVIDHTSAMRGIVTDPRASSYDFSHCRPLINVCDRQIMRVKEALTIFHKMRPLLGFPEGCR